MTFVFCGLFAIVVGAVVVGVIEGVGVVVVAAVERLAMPGQSSQGRLRGDLALLDVAREDLLESVGRSRGLKREKVKRYKLTRSST